MKNKYQSSGFNIILIFIAVFISNLGVNQYLYKLFVLDIVPEMNLKAMIRIASLAFALGGSWWIYMYHTNFHFNKKNPRHKVKPVNSLSIGTYVIHTISPFIFVTQICTLNDTNGVVGYVWLNVLGIAAYSLVMMLVYRFILEYIESDKHIYHDSDYISDDEYEGPRPRRMP